MTGSIQQQVASCTLTIGQHKQSLQTQKETYTAIRLSQPLFRRTFLVVPQEIVE
jgi:hypothetical protein